MWEEASSWDGGKGGRARWKAVLNYFLDFNLLFSALKNSLHDEMAERKLKGF